MATFGACSEAWVRHEEAVATEMATEFGATWARCQQITHHGFINSGEYRCQVCVGTQLQGMSQVQDHVRSRKHQNKVWYLQHAPAPDPRQCGAELVAPLPPSVPPSAPPSPPPSLREPPTTTATTSTIVTTNTPTINTADFMPQPQPLEMQGAHQVLACETRYVSMMLRTVHSSARSSFDICPMLGATVSETCSPSIDA